MAETLTQSGLATMAGQMPIRNREIAEQQKAARLLQLQQAVSQMGPQQMGTPQQAQQMGASMAGQAAAEKVGRAQEMIQTSSQLGKMGQRETQLAAQKELGALQSQAQQEQLNQTARLAALDDSAKREMFDAELQFKKDQANNTLFSERQLADYQRLKASRSQDFQNWAQRAEQLHARNVATLEMINARINEALQQEYRTGKQKLDQETTRQLGEMKRDVEMRLAKARAKAANTAASWGAVGSVLTAAGTAAMFVPGGQLIGAGMMAAGTSATMYGSQQAAKEGSNV
jgi:hypothetical protein